MRSTSRLAMLGLSVLAAAVAISAAPARATDDIAYQTETLPNGLKVVYAPMKNSPAVHVRVLYHVGSKDERPDRQGFAHMFEHMMFRGSQHVASEQHMKMILKVGGNSNAFTSFDQTVYVNTVPAGEVNLPLWLEADRMASFTVSPTIYATERQVVSEEWRLRQNQPYGNVMESLLAMMFTKHHYQWTPIGNMDHLRAANSTELQEFFARYYVPNNAVLVISGDIDVAAVSKTVKQYYGWIPRGAFIKRESPSEPEQTAARRLELPMRVPLARVMIQYPMPPRNDDDTEALDLLLKVLGEGRSSRLAQALVTGKNPMCIRADSTGMGLEDGGAMGVSATVLDGKKPADVEAVLREQIALLTKEKVSDEELAKAKIRARLELVNRWQTATSTASELGEEMLFRGDLSRVKTAQQRIDALKADDLLRVAKKSFTDARSTTLVVVPDARAPLTLAAEPTSQAATEPAGAAARKVNFPADYPTEAPLSVDLPSAKFEKGVEKTIDGVRVIVMTDRRLPIVNWSLTFAGGAYSEPTEKAGLGAMATAMVRRGPDGTTYNAFNEELESRGISLEVGDGLDVTTVSGSALPDQLAYAFKQMRAMVLHPAFDQGEFDRLKTQALNDARLALNSPTGVADRELKLAVYGNNYLGRYVTPASLGNVTLNDVKAYYSTVTFGASKPPLLVIAGDVSVEDGQKLAAELVAGLAKREEHKLPPVAAKRPEARRILLIDRPESRQVNIRMGILAYDIRSEDKFPGSLAGQIMSAGLDSRLNKYVRAEKGLVYGVWGIFGPSRQGGMFEVSTDTKIESAAEAVEACFKVLNDMKAAPVTAAELGDAKLRTAGGMLLGMETIWQQAQRRIDGILNDYPVDYYDVYPQRIAKVQAGEIQDVMKKYVDDGKMTIVIVGPAEQLKDKLAKLGQVEVMKMPLSRP